MCTCIRAYAYVCERTCVCTYLCECMYVCMYVCVRACECVRTRGRERVVLHCVALCYVMSCHVMLACYHLC